jgi:hypothetical protein
MPFVPHHLSPSSRRSLIAAIHFLDRRRLTDTIGLELYGSFKSKPRTPEGAFRLALSPQAVHDHARRCANALLRISEETLKGLSS